MKTTITLLTVILFASLLQAQTTAIPDVNFEKELIALGYDTGSPDGRVPTANINTVTYLNVENANISSLVGIEDFIALTTLNCHNNQLSSLDVSNNTGLITLDCGLNKIISLDLTNNTSLSDLNCYYNKFTRLDISQNTALTTLNCSSNHSLTNLNTSNNTALIRLDCAQSGIVKLDLSKNTKLINLGCGQAQLTSIDVSKNTALETFSCFYNDITKLDVSHNRALTLLRCQNTQLSSLDLTHNTALKDLNCEFNQLTCLNIKNGNNTRIGEFTFLAKNNPDLNCIEVDDVVYSIAKWSGGVDSTTSFNTSCKNQCLIEPAAFINMESTQGFSIYPNPTTGSVHIDLGENNTALNTTVRNTIGQVISTQHFESTDNIRLDIDAPTGIYFLTLETEYGESKTIKVVKE